MVTRSPPAAFSWKCRKIRRRMRRRCWLPQRINLQAMSKGTKLILVCAGVLVSSYWWLPIVVLAPRTDFKTVPMLLDLVIALVIAVNVKRVFLRFVGWIFTPLVIATMAMARPFLAGGEGSGWAVLGFFALCVYGIVASGIGTLIGYFMRRARIHNDKATSPSAPGSL